MKTRRRSLPILAVALVSAILPSALRAQGLAIGAGDLRIEARADGGYDLFVRARPGIASILLTESTKDPAMKADNFAYRAAEFNEVNGRERRMLDGKALPPASKLYSLISSTPLPDPSFGRAFRILIPPVLVYGYPWSRSGAVSVGKGTFINIRSFAKPYADYAGAFLDNPYQIAVSTRPAPPLPAPPPEEPRPAPIQAPQEQPRKEEAPPLPPDDRTSAKVGEAIAAAAGMSLDLVVCLDTTQSMDPYIEDLKKNLGPIIRERVAGFKSFRVGLVLYKDYWPDDYITRKYPFTSDIAAFERSLRGVWVVGGKDIPEAVYEALVAASTEFDWQADRRQIILVTDAPPHPEPRGKIAFADVAKEAGSRHIELDAIIEPDAIPPPNPAHPEFENEARAMALLAASLVPARLLAFIDAGLTEERLLGALDLGPGQASLGSRPLPSGGDASAIKAATEAGATHLVIARAQAFGRDGKGSASGMTETVSRLIEASTGKEIARDVSWTAGPKALFVNGLRAK